MNVDFLPTNGVLEWNPNEVGAKIIPITIVGYHGHFPSVQRSKQFRVTLDTYDSVSSSSILQTVVSIREGGAIFSVLSPNASRVILQNVGAVNFTIAVNSQSRLRENVSVSYRTQGSDNCIEGLDFERISGTFVFAVNQTNKTTAVITVPLLVRTGYYYGAYKRKLSLVLTNVTGQATIDPAYEAGTVYIFDPQAATGTIRF